MLADRSRQVESLPVSAFANEQPARLAVDGLLYSSGVTEGTFTEGEHYTKIDAGVRTRPGDPIEVIAVKAVLIQGWMSQ